MLGIRNVQSGGEFLPAFIGGLMLVAIPFAIGELFLLFLRRYDKDQKIWLTIVWIIQFTIFSGLFLALCYLAPFLVLSGVIVVIIWFVFTSAGTMLKRHVPGLNDWLAILGNAWASFSEAVGRVTKVVGRVIVVLSILAIWAALLWSFVPNIQRRSPGSAGVAVAV
jgi:hypothetical protein